MANGKSAASEVSFFDDGVGVRAPSVVVVLCASSSSSFLKALSLESSSAMGVLPIFSRRLGIFFSRQTEYSFHIITSTAFTIKALFHERETMTTIIQSEDAKNDDSMTRDDDDGRFCVECKTDLRNKIVLVRVDHNAVKDRFRTRFESKVPSSTLYSIVERGGRPIVMTHVNRPRDKKTKTIAVDEKDGTRAIAKYLTKKLGVVFANPKVDSSLSTTKGNERENDDDDDGGIEMSQIFKDDTMQTMIKDLKERRIGGIYLPNMRWFSGEERGTEEIGIRLARDLASIADVFVNDAFGSWQPYVSTFEVAKLLPSYAGLLMQRELDAMTRVLEPKRPFVAVVAGSKVNTKIGTLVNVAKKVRHIDFRWDDL